MTHLDSINPELLNTTTHGILMDACRMGEQLCTKVNVSWTLRRLKEEHDTWSKHITDVLYEASNRELNISPVFRKLAEKLDGLLTTSKDLAYEGRRQHHCVATYASAVDSGRCAIWHINGYTAEIARDHSNKLFLKQFLGHKNVQAPAKLRLVIEEELVKFNASEGFSSNLTDYIVNPVYANLPF